MSGKFSKHVVKGTEKLSEKIGQTVLIEISALYTATCYLAVHALSDSAENFPWKSATIKKGEIFITLLLHCGLERIIKYSERFAIVKSNVYESDNLQVTIY